MRVLRSSDYRRMPWKNDGGETIEMLLSPEGASLDDFDWRVSMAHVAKPGPFSLFQGIDRTLSVIGGLGLALTFADRTAVLTNTSAPFRFAGDEHVGGALVEGAIDDLNVMTRRGRCDHRVTRHTLTGPTVLAWDADACLLVAIGGPVDVEFGPQTLTLANKDSIRLDAGDVRTFTVTPQGHADIFVIEVSSS